MPTGSKDNSCAASSNARDYWFWLPDRKCRIRSVIPGLDWQYRTYCLQSGRKNIGRTMRNAFWATNRSPKTISKCCSMFMTVTPDKPAPSAIIRRHKDFRMNAMDIEQALHQLKQAQDNPKALTVATARIVDPIPPETFRNSGSGFDPHWFNAEILAALLQTDTVTAADWLERLTRASHGRNLLRTLKPGTCMKPRAWLFASRLHKTIPNVSRSSRT